MLALSLSSLPGCSSHHHQHTANSGESGQHRTFRSSLLYHTFCEHRVFLYLRHFQVRLLDLISLKRKTSLIEHPFSLASIQPCWSARPVRSLLAIGKLLNHRGRSNALADIHHSTRQNFCTIRTNKMPILIDGTTIGRCAEKGCARPFAGDLHCSGCHANKARAHFHRASRKKNKAGFCQDCYQRRYPVNALAQVVQAAHLAALNQAAQSG
jgi:hypothetical protein